MIYPGKINPKRKTTLKLLQDEDLRILHLSGVKEWRGGERQVYFLLKALEGTANYQQALMSPKNALLTQKAQQEGITTLSTSLFSGFDLNFARKLKRFCHHFQPHFIHAHDAKAHNLSILAHFLGLQIPLIVSRRVAFPIGKSRWSAYKYNHPAVVKIITVSDAVCSIVQSGIHNPHIVERVYSAIDLQEWENVQKSDLKAQLQLPKSALLVAKVGALGKDKDYATYLKMAALVLPQKPNTHFLVIGRGPEEDALKALAQKLGISENVHFLGYQKAVKTLLKAVDVFAMTSAKEGLGTAVLDAFAAGLPVVCTKVGGLPEMVTHEENGWLGIDPPSLAEGMLQLLNNAEDRKEMGLKNRGKVKKFSVATMGEETMKIYQSLQKGG